MSARLFLGVFGVTSLAEEEIKEAIKLLRLDPDAKLVWSSFDDHDPEACASAAQVVWFSITNR